MDTHAATQGKGARRRRIYLVRHGHVSYFDAEGRPINPREVRLSPWGVNQIQCLAKAMEQARIDRAVCSDYPRAVQSAELLLAGRGLAAQADPAFREIRSGRLREVAPERREQDIAYAYERAANDAARFIGGERFADFERRILDAFTALLADSGWEHLLLVSHDAVNRVLLGWTVGCGRAAMAAFEQDLACLNVLDAVTEGGRVIRRLVRAANLTPYDAVKAAMLLTGMEEVFRSYQPEAK
jgi:broad specificity phosphatase PhoE